MKRLLICFAAMAFWAVDHSEVAAQSGTNTGSYQSILQTSAPGYNSSGSASYGTYGSSSYTQPATSYPGINSGYQETTNHNAGSATRSLPPAAATQAAPAAPYTLGSCEPYSAGAPVAGGPAYVDQGSYDCTACNTGQGLGGITGQGPGGFVAQTAGNSRNVFYGLNGLVFDRDFEDDVFLTRDLAGNNLLSTDADTGTLGGLEFFLGSRNSCGNGVEARYWGLFADDAVATLSGGAGYDIYRTDIAGLIWPATGEDLATVFNRADTNTITRSNEIHNLEFNFLRRGGCYTTRFGRPANFELLHGFRWFEFDENFQWDLTDAAAPNALSFDTDVQNTLLGYQLGSRSTVCLGERLAVNWGTKFGVFNNRARVRQSIQSDAGIYATVGAGGPDYNFADDKNDISLLGELDLGFSYNIRNCSRVNLGYRAIGVSGIALAPDQFTNFNTEAAIRDVQSNGDLILHGAYFGFEFCK